MKIYEICEVIESDSNYMTSHIIPIMSMYDIELARTHVKAIKSRDPSRKLIIKSIDVEISYEDYSVSRKYS